MEYLHNNRPIVHCESITGWVYKFIYDEDMDFTCYKSKGCVIVKLRFDAIAIDNANIDSNLRFTIHQVAEDADIIAVYKHVLDNEKEEGFKRTIMLYPYAPWSDEIDVFIGFRNFARVGCEYHDHSVRKMTKDDEAIAKEMSEASLANDTNFGKRQANNMMGWFEDSRDQTLLGIFEKDKLVGLVTAIYYADVGVAMVADLFIHKDYRKCGCGARLVKSALGLYPDIEYYYQSAKTNHASIALAKSLGFTLAGAALYALDEE